MYLIDGHNLIGQGLIPQITIDQEDDEARLVLWLRAHQPNLGAKMTVVFDGGIPGGTSLALSGGGVTAVFAAHRRTDADSVILQRVRRASNPSQIVVVSNDARLREEARRLGASVMRGDDFLARLRRPSKRHRRRASTSELTFKENPRLSKQEMLEYLQMFGLDGDDADV